MKIAKSRRVLFVSIIIIAFLSGCSASTKFLQAENGILNLRQWDFARDGNINLDGGWEF